MSYDAIIVGLGAMGSAIACHLARRGRRVLALDRYRPPHPHGSSHGGSRIIREAYFEHPTYVPMVRRAYELWDALERESGVALYRRTGGLMIGAPDSALVSGALRSAREHGLAHERVDASEIRRRFPVLAPESDMVGVFEPRAGVLFPESCIAAHLGVADAKGAELRFDEPMLGWEDTAAGVRVVTGCGEYDAHRLIVCAGAWVGDLLADLAPSFTVERQVLHWFDPLANAPSFDPDRCPIHLWQFDAGEFYYGFPDLGEGIKVGRHHLGAAASAEMVDRSVSAAEVDDMRRLLRRFTPAADGALRASQVCLYTNTRNEHFWIDAHPRHPHALIVSACSGHGFKFASVIGEIVADVVIEGKSRFDLSLFAAR